MVTEELELYSMWLTNAEFSKCPNWAMQAEVQRAKLPNDGKTNHVLQHGGQKSKGTA